MKGLFERPAGGLVMFGALSLAAVSLGAYVGARSGVPAGVWTRNLAAWGLGALAAVATARIGRPGLAALGLLPIGLGASLFFPDLTGVRRWIDIGPVHLNAAMLLMPMAAVTLAAPEPRPAGRWAAVITALILLVAQPDASQATTLAAVATLAAAMTVRSAAARTGLILAATGIAAVAWTRPDRLAPVPEVEGIVGLAWALSPVLGAAALLLPVAVAAAPLLAASGRADARPAGAALGLCLLGWTAAPLFGAFPVPLAGMGMSPILGAWLGAGLLAAVMREQAGEGR